MKIKIVTSPWEVLAARVEGKTWQEIAEHFGLGYTETRNLFMQTGCIDTWSKGSVLLRQWIEPMVAERDKATEIEAHLVAIAVATNHITDLVGLDRSDIEMATVLCEFSELMEDEVVK